jgi:hypothetical protein
MNLPGPWGAQSDGGIDAAEFAGSLEPAGEGTECANHLRIPDLRNDQAEGTSRFPQRDFRRRSVPRLSETNVSDSWIIFDWG